MAGVIEAVISETTHNPRGFGPLAEAPDSTSDSEPGMNAGNAITVG